MMPRPKPETRNWANAGVRASCVEKSAWGRAMQTENVVDMRGDPDRIFQLAADIQDWPIILPHYRYVVVEERTELTKVARMGAKRDFFPVSWQTTQDLRPDERRIRFFHIGGITKGMDVEWRIEPGRGVGGSVRVTISHSLNYAVPVLGAWFAGSIVGKLFVHYIAGKTLGCIKEIVEREAKSSRESVASSSRE
jgi:ribosome-associated toxin RatA of RatAB toxin-antitoxin module